MNARANRERLEHDVRARRALEQSCALDFLAFGDGEEGTFLGHHVAPVRHAERCVHGPADPCSLDYDPLPYPEAEPAAGLYEGTGIGALYGVPNCPAADLGGWRLVPRSTR